jgi:exodeoxyribonuclease VII small subunit
MTKRNPASFEQEFKELEKLVQELESNSVQLEDGLAKFQLGLVLAQSLKAKLTEVENKVEIIKKKFSHDMTDNSSSTTDDSVGL